MKKVVSWLTMIAGLVAGYALFSGIVKDQWEIAPYRPLLQSLRSGKPGERMEAALELGVLRLGGASLKTAVLPLVESLDDPDSRVREAAADSLALFGADAAPATAALATIIRHNHSGLRARAIRIICLIDSGEARLILAEAMTDPDPDKRIETVGVVSNLNRTATPFIPLLLENLRRDPTPVVRKAILNALVAIEPTSDRVAGARLEALSDPDTETRKAAVLGFGSPDPSSFILHLRQAAVDQDAGVRVEAIRMLSKVGFKHLDAVPALCQALTDPATRNEARIAIGHLDWIWPLRDVASLDTALESDVPALIAAAKQSDPRTRGVIVSLLCRLIGQFGQEDLPLPVPLRAAGPQLRVIVKDAEPIVRLYVLLSLLLEPPNELLIPVLDEVLREGDFPSRKQAGAPDSPWPAVIAALGTKLRAHDDVTKTRFLIHLLSEDLVERLVPTLTAASNDDDRDMRLQAMTVLGDVAHAQASSGARSNCLLRYTIPAIVATLESQFSDTREYASWILGNLGPAAREAVPALREMIARENDSTVRTRAEESLSHIEIVSKPNVPSRDRR